MKPVKRKYVLHKVKSKSNVDVYYTMEHWKTKRIDGKLFIKVTKKDPTITGGQQTFWMCKQNLDYIS